MKSQINQASEQREQDEERLVGESLRGNQDALESLFSRYASALYPTAFRLLGNRQDAEDALQEGLLSAFRNLRRFEGRSQFSTWLTRIVIKAALMRMRSQRARPTSLDDQREFAQDELPLIERMADRAPNPEEAYTQKEATEIIERNIRTLSPSLRTALMLRDVKGLSTEEAAQALGVPQGTLKSQLHRARARLAALLREGLGARTAK